MIEEWRGRLGAGTRMQQPQIEGIFGPMSRYAQRLPIGTPESLKAFTVERLRDFYRAHYRANRMAVVVVGDIPPAEAERQIKELFAGVAGGAAARPVYPIPPHHRHALRDRVRSRGAGLLGVDHPQAAAARADLDCRLPALAGGRADGADGERAAGRDGAPAGGAVPGRVGRRSDPGAVGAGAGDFGARQRRPDSPGPERHRAGSGAGQAVWLRRRGVRPRAAFDAGAVRADVQRA